MQTNSRTAHNWARLEKVLLTSGWPTLKRDVSFAIIIYRYQEVEVASIINTVHRFDIKQELGFSSVTKS